MIIDIHTHIFPDKFAEHAMNVLASGAHGLTFHQPVTAGGLLAAMDRCGVDKSVVCHTVTKESQHENVLRFAKETDGGRLISFGSVMPGSEYALEYLWKISDEGLKGIKLHPALQRVRPDEEKYFPLYDLARALNLVVLFHAGWDPSYPDELAAPPESMVTIARNFPGLKIVAAHMGGLHMAKDVLDNVAGKCDICFDTAFSADGEIDEGLFGEIIKKHGPERILMGSDFPWHLPSQEIAMIRALDISEEDKNLILGGNAARILGIAD